MKPDIILVDGSSYLYRAYHAMPSFSNSKGEPTGAIYGVLNMMRRLIQEYPQSAIAVVFDAKGKTFRDELYSEYKANRPSMPEELAAQIMPLNQALEALGFPLLTVAGVEADDVIGTLAKQANEKKIRTLISTGDKDLAQLVNENIHLSNSMNDSYMDSSGVLEKFGVPPDLIIDYLTLIGDNVDNVPGVPKVGPKTAVKWLCEFGSLDSIIEHANDIKGKVGENLRSSLDQLPLSKELVTIDCDVDLPLNIDQLNRRSIDKDRLIELFKRFEFRTWLSELLAVDEVEPTEKKGIDQNSFDLIDSQEKFNALLKQIEKENLFSFDTETTSLDYTVAQLVGVSFAASHFPPCYIPLGHDYDEAPKQLSLKEVLEKLKPVLENASIPKVGQNLKYDMSVLARYDIHLCGIAHDTMLESYVLDSVGSRHDLDSLSLKYLGHKTIHFEDIAGKGAKQISFNKIRVEDAAPYAAEDAEIAFKLHQTLYPKLEKEPGLNHVYQTIEIPLIEVLSRIERNGVLIDAECLFEQSEAFAKQIIELEAEAQRLAGSEFNLSSPKQIQKVLFEDLGLPVLKKTPKGQPSTAEDVLQELAQDYELPSCILRHRSVSKLKSTYTDKLPQQINPATGRVHTSYHQAVAATGRLSSSDPNLQNIPIRNEEGRRIRKAFIAPEGFKLVAADYSQIELRILAHISGDEGLLEAFEKGLDIHSATASEVFGVAIGEVNSDQRRYAKAINFGLVYGMSAFGLARQLDTDRNTAQEYMDHYFDRYPGVKRYMEEIRKSAKQRGYVETLAGRRLYLPDIKASNVPRRQYAERTAINAPMQGTAADIIKMAMIKCHHWIGMDNRQVRMIMQVHDELVFEVSVGILDETVQTIRTLMETAYELKVPLEVGIGVGDNWDEAH
ncbi:MAG: DNA polymerase I [Gammaproteobacteria bacterium]|nr:DNA polymerase I [Gammaproteobacteria bacterium]